MFLHRFFCYNILGDNMLKILKNIELTNGEIFGLVGLVDSGRTTMIQNIYRDNPRMVSYVYKMPKFNFKVKTVLKKNFDHKYVRKLNLNIEKRISQLNYTETRKLLFLLSIFTKKEVIILDDPLLLIDQDTKKEMIGIIKELGKTVIISLDNTTEAEVVCNRFAIIKEYRVVEVTSNDDDFKFTVVTIEAKDIDKKKLPLKEMKIKNFNHDMMEFIYKGDINNLLKYLVDIEIKSLQIRESNLEELYKYYFNDTNKK